jgi:hypothetical protein
MNADKQQATPNATKQRTYLFGAKTALLILVLASGAALLVRGMRHLSPSDVLVSSPSHSSGLPFYWKNVDVPSTADSRIQRLVYPYSVIPGGVVSSKELVTALQRDPVAAAHYSDFRADSARIMRLPSARQVYVSYRLGDRVFWTSKKIVLAAGETVLTDGTHLARTRCGNRLSEVPGPTSPSQPPREAMDRPVYEPPVDGPADTFPGAPLWSERANPSLMAMNGPITSGSGGNSPFVPPLPLGPCCGTPIGPSGSSPKTPPPGIPPGSGPSPLPQPPTPPGTPVATPEPQTLLLLIVGLSALFVASLFRRS